MSCFYLQVCYSCISVVDGIDCPLGKIDLSDQIRGTGNVGSTSKRVPDASVSENCAWWIDAIAARCVGVI